MAMRTLAAKPPTAKTSGSRTSKSGPAPLPSSHLETAKPDCGFVPYRFGDVPLLSPGESLPSAPLLAGLAPLPWPIQAKLEVGAVNDPLEREADRVAEHVMRMPAPVPLPSGPSGEIVQRKCKACAQAEEQQTVRRKCDSCEEEDNKKKDEETHEKLSRKESRGASTMDGSSAPAIVGEVLQSPGHPLDSATRAFFEPRFGHELGHVRVHTGTRPAESAHAVRAKAYTVGSHIVFAGGQHSPSSAAGRHLLAHELAHCLQQQPGRALVTTTASGHSPEVSQSAGCGEQSAGVSHPTPQRVARVPSTTADFLVTGKKNAAGDTMNIYFERNSSTVDIAEKAKIPQIITSSTATGALVLNGFTSEDEPAALATTRAAAVDAALASAAPPHTGTRTHHAMPASGTGQIEYRNLRKVEVLAAPTAAPPPVSAVPSCAGGAATACGTAFSTAHPIAVAMVGVAIAALSAAPLAVNTTTMLTSLFGGAAAAGTVKGKLGKLHTHLTAMPAQMRCHNQCDADCTNPAYNCGLGIGVPAADPCHTPGSKAMMTLCPNFLAEPNINKRAETLVHEGSHGTTGLQTSDLSYGVERGIILLSPADALRNTDSYALLVRNLHTPGSVSIGPSPADVITGSGTCPTADPVICKGLANLEKWAVTARQDISGVYGEVQHALPPGSWSVSYDQVLMHDIAALFGLTDPGAAPPFNPPVADDKVKLAGIYDRYNTMMYQIYQNQVTINKVPVGVAETWTYGTPATVTLNPTFMIRSAVGQVRRLYELLAAATPGIPAPLQASYVEAADRIRRKRVYGP